MKRLFLLMVLVQAFTLSLFADLVPIEEARIIAKNIYFERVQSLRAVPLAKIKITEEFTIKMGLDPVYYVFNIGDDEGFVIVSAEDLVYPVPGYSFHGKYRLDDHHPAFDAQMQLFELQIVDSRAATEGRYSEIEEAWEKYNRKNFLASKNIQTVGPICKTTWDQGKFYNDSCPNNSVTGCVATAMAQTMKALKWPPQGKGSYSYTHNYYGLQYANFGNTTYKWNDMPNVVTAPNASVAQLMYHCGVSVDMNYSPGGSSANMHRAKDAFFYYFKFSPFIRTAQKAAYSDIYWKILIRAQHMNGRPVIYSGPGHAFICDGFQYPDHFHFNWGWGGLYDGYFYMTSLKPGGHNYTNGQDAILDAYPDTVSTAKMVGEGGFRMRMDEGMEIMPNPSPDGNVQLALLHEYSGDVTIIVAGVSGQVFERVFFKKESEWSLSRLNLGHLSQGIYLIRVTMGDETFTRKFIKQ